MTLHVGRDRMIERCERIDRNLTNLRFIIRETMDHMGQPVMQANGFAKRNYEVSSNFNRVHVPQFMLMWPIAWCHAWPMLCVLGWGGWDEQRNRSYRGTEAVDLLKVDAGIEVEESMTIVDGIGSFNTVDFLAAYDYYNEYDRIKGFSVRRSKMGCRTKQGSEGEIIWQIFVFSREGKREEKHMQRKDKKMDSRPTTRCRCEARIKVHVDDTSERWYVEKFCDNHNHAMLDARFRGLMRSHRTVKEGDLHQISLMRKAGLRVTTVGSKGGRAQHMLRSR
ncbi:hypothetical protein Ahy_A07g036779 [Arachis hypogaea]|uniref:FAR1 domain-containing protein n=1 Tax=Arachis hypogaea TaxID=3818 RepID=A0A445CH22_ARAHY|nr:hypothetical protein Ahy_A07g036779 [Arachis hypogaea]